MTLLGNTLTFVFILALLACGTGTQGDDDAWAASLFLLAPIAGFGMLTLYVQFFRKGLDAWLSKYHLVSLLLAVVILPSYWLHVTIGGGRILVGAGLQDANAYPAEDWHRYWAPGMTLLAGLLVGLMVLAYRVERAERKAVN